MILPALLLAGALAAYAWLLWGGRWRPARPVGHRYLRIARRTFLLFGATAFGCLVLLGRVEAGGIDEVVLAMNATLEGQTTAHYIAERIERFPVRVTQLAHGLPVGGELDYLDEGTLAAALRQRTLF